MFERFTDKARRAVVLAQEEARMLQHQEIGPEHLLLALTRDDGAAGQALAAAGVTTEPAIEALTAVAPAGDRPITGHMPFTVPARRVMEQALREALTLGHSYVGTDHLLLALLAIADEDTTAVAILTALGTTTEALRRQVMGDLPSDPAGPFEFNVFAAAASDRLTVHPDAGTAGAAAGDEGTVTPARFTLGRGECFSINSGPIVLRDDLRYLDYGDALRAAARHGATVCILSPVSHDITALDSTGTPVVIGTGTSWAPLAIADRLIPIDAA